MRIIGKRKPFTLLRPIDQGPGRPKRIHPDIVAFLDGWAALAPAFPCEKGALWFSSHEKANAHMDRLKAEAMALRCRDLKAGKPIERRAMTDNRKTHPATIEDVKKVAALLGAAGCEYMLIGGYAMNAQGLPRQTGDVDILVRNTPENNQKWIAALSQLPDGAAGDLQGVDNPFLPDPTAVDFDPENADEGAIRLLDVFVIDVMPSACGKTYEDLAPFAHEIEVDGEVIVVLDFEGLLLTKQGVRPQDISDRSMLQTAIQIMDEEELDEQPHPEP